MTTQFSQTGGARIGRSYWRSMNVTIPFAKFQADENQILLRAMGKDYRFPKDSITRIWTMNGLISRGIQIEHDILDYPKYVVFWVADLDKAQNSLRNLGYNVT